jgi:argininosuccinate synthase
LLSALEIIEKLNKIGGMHGIGRIDHIEDRLVGIKSREIYEAPAATILIKAHQYLEALTLSKSSLDFKRLVENEYARVIYLGDWFSPHHMDLLSYLQHNQRNVGGIIRLKLHKGNCIVVGRFSDIALYQKVLATYSSESVFDQKSATAFVKFLGMESSIQSKVQLSNFDKEINQLIKLPNESS